MLRIPLFFEASFVLRLFTLPLRLSSILLSYISSNLIPLSFIFPLFLTRSNLVLRQAFLILTAQFHISYYELIFFCQLLSIPFPYEYHHHLQRFTRGRYTNCLHKLNPHFCALRIKNDHNYSIHINSQTDA